MSGALRAQVDGLLLCLAHCAGFAPVAMRHQHRSRRRRTDATPPVVAACATPTASHAARTPTVGRSSAMAVSVTCSTRSRAPRSRRSFPSRYEGASLIVTSNKVFGRWGEVFGDDVVAAAMIDRLVHHAEVLALRRQHPAQGPRSGPGPTHLHRRWTRQCVTLCHPAAPGYPDTDSPATPVGR